MPTIPIAAYYQVTAGCAPGVALPEHTRWFDVLADEISDPELVGMARSQAHRYAESLTGVTWVSVCWHVGEH